MLKLSMKKLGTPDSDPPSDEGSGGVSDDGDSPFSSWGLRRRWPANRGMLRGLLLLARSRGCGMPRSQLRQVVRKFKLKRDKEFTRCLSCNEILVQCDHADAAPKVPTNVSSTQEEFVRCRNCGKIYWKGAHWRRMSLVLDGVTSS